MTLKRRKEGSVNKTAGCQVEEEGEEEGEVEKEVEEDGEEMGEGICCELAHTADERCT